MYARLATLGLLIISLILGMATIDGWTVVRYYGAKQSTIVAATTGAIRSSASPSRSTSSTCRFIELLGFVVALAW